MRGRGLALALPLLWAFTSPPDAAAPAPSEEDPCAELREAIEKRQDYLRRVAAERDAFGWVENPEDAQALRLLQGLRRCAEHPDDEDCRPPPIEVRLEDLEIPRHVYERRPSELEAGDKLPDEVPHDPRVLDLLRRLELCEARKNPQPLLRSHEPGPRPEASPVEDSP